MYNVGGIPVLQCKLSSLDVHTEVFRVGLKPSTVLLNAGHQREAGKLAFKVATIFDRDVQITLRDGTTLYADVFRPQQSPGKVPAIIHWSPYGKTGQGVYSLEPMPARGGIPREQNSGYESFQALDPATWTSRGYAIVNVDARGIYSSGGDLRWFGKAEGRDGYDVVEAVAKLPWCDGSVGLGGTSWLAISQWFIAVERPPHLKCIAPLDGFSDYYRDTAGRGGIMSPGFGKFIQSSLFGSGMQEDVVAMMEKYNYINPYWEDKRADISKIQVPAFVVATYASPIHTRGCLRGYEEILHNKKWLRIPDTHEWYDIYQESTVDELQQFYDFYLKGLQNGWETTPRVRVSLLGFNNSSMKHRIFEHYPPVKFQDCTKLYFTSNRNLTESPEPSQQLLTYQSDTIFDNPSGELSFSFSVTHRTALVGYSKAILNISSPDNDNMDIYVQIRKADRRGKLLSHLNIPSAALGMTEVEAPNIGFLKYMGPQGILRASRRAIKPELSSDIWPTHSHDKDEMVPPGQIVDLEIGIWPTGMIFEEGEQLVVKIAGHSMDFNPNALISGPESVNVGKHYLHTGGKFNSHIILPLISLD